MQKELAYRENDGIAVTLFWHSGSDRLSVSVYDWRNGDWFELDPLDCAFLPAGTEHEYWSYGAERILAAFCVAPRYR